MVIFITDQLHWEGGGYFRLSISEAHLVLDVCENLNFGWEHEGIFGKIGWKVSVEIWQDLARTGEIRRDWLKIWGEIRRGLDQ